MRWLRRLFNGSDNDPIIAIAGGLSEPEAEMNRELLINEGIPASVRDAGSLAAYRVSLSTFEILVKASDAQRAREVLASVLKPDEGIS
jgi:hypothetical protein